MTALSALLAENPSDHSGVYQLPADVSDDVVAEVVAGAGWRLVVADTSNSDDKRAVLGDFQAAFGFPDWFGKNLDALVDALRDLDEPGAVLLWRGGDQLEVNDADDYRRILAVLRDRAQADSPARLVTLLGSRTARTE